MEYDLFKRRYIDGIDLDNPIRRDGYVEFHTSFEASNERHAELIDQSLEGGLDPNFYCGVAYKRAGFTYSVKLIGLKQEAFYDDFDRMLSEIKMLTRRRSRQLQKDKRQFPPLG